MEEEDYPNFSLEFNFPSIQKRPKSQMNNKLSFVARRGSFISYFIKEIWGVGRTLDKLETTPLRVVVSHSYLVFSQPPACLHQAM